jgi:hypothetical protein
MKILILKIMQFFNNFFKQNALFHIKTLFIIFLKQLTTKSLPTVLANHILKWTYFQGHFKVKENPMIKKKISIIILAMSLTVSLIFCAQKHPTLMNVKDELIDISFSNKNLSDPKKLFYALNNLIADGRFSEDEIANELDARLLGTPLNTICSKYGKTVLYYAAKNGNITVINIIFKVWKSDPWHLLSIQETHRNHTPLHIAVVNCNPETINKLLELAKPHTWEYITMLEKHNWNVFHLVAENCKHASDTECNHRKIFKNFMGYAPDTQTIAEYFFIAQHNWMHWFHECKETDKWVQSGKFALS